MHKSYQSTLPSSNRLLKKKWDDKYYAEHRILVRDARPSIDTRPPRTYMHLHMKLKKLQLEEERAATIERDNRILLEKMSTIMRTTGRIDNRNDYQGKSLNHEKRRRELLRVARENSTMIKRINERKPDINQDEWHKNWSKNAAYLDNIAKYELGWHMPKSARPRAADEPAGRSMDRSSEPPANHSQGHPTEQPADRPRERSAKKSAEHPRESSAEKPAERPQANAPESVTDRLRREAAERLAEKSAELPKEQPAGKLTDHLREKVADKVADHPQEHAAEKPAARSPQRSAGKSAKQSRESSADTTGSRSRGLVDKVVDRAKTGGSASSGASSTVSPADKQGIKSLVNPKINMK